jgi:hypothetical protein
MIFVLLLEIGFSFENNHGYLPAIKIIAVEEFYVEKEKTSGSYF